MNSALTGTSSTSHEAIKERIKKNRTADVTLTVENGKGQPLANANVTVRMTRHKFLLGCNGFMLKPSETSDLQTRYRKLFTKLLNYATLPFYWGGFEPEQGKPSTELLVEQARWFTEHGVAVKGHPLVWNMVPPKWVPADVKELQRLQEERVRREVTNFRGLVDCWDVINEVVAWDRPEVQNPLTELGKALGDLDIVKWAFAAARESNPGAFLLINDFRTDAAYADLIRRCMEAGVPIDGIGIQTHMHMGACSAGDLWNNLERFTPFGKPLHLTEVTLISGAIRKDMNWYERCADWATTPEGEVRQAKEVEMFYSLAFSHPRVEAITWWDFPDGQWLGAPSGLVRKDMTPKPAYDVLYRLFREEWWTPKQALRTDADGKVNFHGYLGSYEIVAAGAKTVFAVETAGATKVCVNMA